MFDRDITTNVLEVLGTEYVSDTSTWGCLTDDVIPNSMIQITIHRKTPDGKLESTSVTLPVGDRVIEAMSLLGLDVRCIIDNINGSIQLDNINNIIVVSGRINRTVHMSALASNDKTITPELYESLLKRQAPQVLDAVVSRVCITRTKIRPDVRFARWLFPRRKTLTLVSYLESNNVVMTSDTLSAIYNIPSGISVNGFILDHKLSASLEEGRKPSEITMLRVGWWEAVANAISGGANVTK